MRGSSERRGRRCRDPPSCFSVLRRRRRWGWESGVGGTWRQVQQGCMMKNEPRWEGGSNNTVCVCGVQWESATCTSVNKEKSLHPIDAAAVRLWRRGDQRRGAHLTRGAPTRGVMPPPSVISSHLFISEQRQLLTQSCHTDRLAVVFLFYRWASLCHPHPPQRSHRNTGVVVRAARGEVPCRARLPGSEKELTQQTGPLERCGEGAQAEMHLVLRDVLQGVVV